MALALSDLQLFCTRRDTKAELGYPGHMCPPVLDRGDSVLASVPVSSGRRCELSSGDTQPGSGSRASWNTTDECLPMGSATLTPH